MKEPAGSGAIPSTSHPPGQGKPWLEVWASKVSDQVASCPESCRGGGGGLGRGWRKAKKGQAGEGAPTHAASQGPAVGCLICLQPAARSALLPACPSPRPAADTHSPQELDLVLASFSPFGHGFRGVGGAPASEASAAPGSRPARAACCCALPSFSSSSSSSGSWLSLSSAELIPDRTGSRANTPPHCRAPMPAKQSAYSARLARQPSARRPRARRRAQRWARGEGGGGSGTLAAVVGPPPPRAAPRCRSEEARAPPHREGAATALRLTKASCLAPAYQG